MPFLFKLSKRVARLKHRVVVLSTGLLAVVTLFACEKPAGITDPGTNPGTDSATRLVLSPKILSLRQNQTADFTAIALTSSGDTAHVTVDWSVTSGGITDTSTNGGRHVGRYKAASDTGRIKVIARGHPGAATDTAIVSVTLAPVAQVSVSPTAASVLVGRSVQFTATTLDSLHNALSGRAVTWSSSNATVASITSGGLVTAAAMGTATLTATSEGQSGSAVLTVVNVPVASVAVSPASASVQAGATLQLTAAPQDSAGNPLAGRPVSWATSNATIATVSGSGLVTAVAAGSATITASAEGKSGTASVTVTSVPVASVGVAPATASVQVGQTTQLMATPKDQSGNALSGRTVTWSSSNTSVATVSSGGLVAGATAGTATITATSEGKSGAAAVTVTTPPTSTGECASPRAGWIWCDDFEQDRSSSYFEVDNAGGNFTRASGVGVSGSMGMRARWASVGQTNAGALHLAFGRTPQSYFRAVDGGTANYRELYWRVYVRNQAGWVGGGADKLTRAISFASSSTWAEAMIAHVWSGYGAPRSNYMLVDPASGTDASGNLVTTTYNDFANLRWLGAAQSATPLFDASHVGPWYCVEAHARLNDPGSANGVFELWINGTPEAQTSGLNWVGGYTAYGINALYLENFWNDGAPQAEERYLDNLVVSTQPIGCVGTPPPPPAPPPPPPAPVASVSVNPASLTPLVGGTQQVTAVLKDASGNTLTGRSVSWQSSAPLVASVTTTGLVSGLLPGVATVTATSEGQIGTAQVTVSAPPSGTGDPLPGVGDVVVVDGRAALQQYSTLAEAQAGVPLTDPENLDHFFWTTNMDGAGTHALGFQVASSGGVCQDDGGHMTIPAFGNPTRLYFQWKQRLGRTATGGGLGAVGSFAINNAACGNAGRKEVLFSRNVADLGGGGRIDYTWPGPAPAVPRFEGFYGTAAGASDYGPNQGWMFYPQDHVGETITQTLYVQAESPPGASDGIVRLWINGRLLIEATHLALGTEGINRILIPATFRAPAQDQTEYFWGFVAWMPR